MKSLTKDELTPGLDVIVISKKSNFTDTISFNNGPIFLTLKCMGFVRYIKNIFYEDTKENRTFLLLDNKKIGGFDESQRPNRNRNTDQQRRFDNTFL